VAQAGPNKVNLTDQLVESFVSDIILFLFEILGPTRTSEFRKRHFDSPDYGRNGPNSDDESHYGGFQKTKVYSPEETLRLPSISKIDLSVI
jgi:hypothetical protein